MQKTKMSRETLLPLLANYALAYGLADSSLRPLAKAAGTSDRMLLYHFGTKSELMDALMNHIADMYSVMLDSMFPSGRAVSNAACLGSVMAVMRRDEMQPFLRLWWQAVAGAASGELGWRSSTGRIMGTLLTWLEGHIPPDEPDPAGTARLILTIIEGAGMLDATGRSDIADLAIAKAFPE